MNYSMHLCLNTRCNYCRGVCNVYRRKEMEFNSPRGKIELIYEVLNNRIDQKEVTKFIYQCLACRKCSSACPYNIDTSKILWDYRDFFKSYCVRKYLFMIAYLTRSGLERLKIAVTPVEKAQER